MKAILTPEQSRAARRALGLTQNQLIEKCKLSAFKLKQFESGFADPDGVAPFLRELRDFYEAQNYIFTDIPDAANTPQPGESVRVVRDALVLCNSLNHTQRGMAQGRIRSLLAELENDLQEKAGEGVFDLYDDETDLARDKAIAVLAEIGVLYTALLGNCVLNVPTEALLSKPRQAKTIADVVALRFADALKLISHSNQNSRSKKGDEGASGGGSDNPTLDGDGKKTTASLAATN